MEKIFALIIGVLLITIKVNAQDVIVKNDNSTILAKIIKVSASEIEYKKWSNIDGPTYVINISDVIRINYENGDSDIFKVNASTRDLNESDNPQYCKGLLKIKNGSRLTSDGVLLSENEIKQLLGKKYYEDYQTGKRFLKASGTLEVFFILSAIPAFYFIAGGIGDRNASALTTGLLFASVSVPCGVLFCIFDNVGTRKINFIVNEYNNHCAKHATLSMGITSNGGVGLTLNF